jgi:5'(3')-deoxyribonucleotidase
MKENSPTLYIDMDGVVADFYGFAATVLRQPSHIYREKWTHDQWEKLKNYPCLYKYLPKTEQADHIIIQSRKFRDFLGWRLYMLTAVPKGNDVPDAFSDKISWMQRHYPDIPVRFGPYAKDKQHHCNPGDVLMDDRVSNCEEWVQAGGRAILAKDLNRALEELKNMFEDEYQKNSYKYLNKL